MKIINKISNFFSKRSITASIRNKLMMDWSDENIFLENRVKRENFLNTIFPSDGELLIALHNNFKGYNVYQEVSKSDTVSIKDNQNPRDFFLCTNREDFNILSKSPYNVVLQESYPKNDDGSLSWAALKWGVRYVNIEVRLGWLSMQKKMLK